MCQLIFLLSHFFQKVFYIIYSINLHCWISGWIPGPVDPWFQTVHTPNKFMCSKTKAWHPTSTLVVWSSRKVQVLFLGLLQIFTPLWDSGYTISVFSKPFNTECYQQSVFFYDTFHCDSSLHFAVLRCHCFSLASVRIYPGAVSRCSCSLTLQ